MPSLRYLPAENKSRKTIKPQSTPAPTKKSARRDSFDMNESRQANLSMAMPSDRQEMSCFTRFLSIFGFGKKSSDLQYLRE